jgi:hypothetical protein
VSERQFVEYVIVDRNGNDARLCDGPLAAQEMARRWNESPSTSSIYQRPYRVIKRTITEAPVNDA